MFVSGFMPQKNRVGRSQNHFILRNLFISKNNSWDFSFNENIDFMLKNIDTISISIAGIVKSRKQCIFTFLAHLSTKCSAWAFIIGWLSVVRRRASTFTFKHLLLINHWDNFNQTSQECSLGGPLPDSFKKTVSMQNSGCHGNRKKKLKKYS